MNRLRNESRGVLTEETNPRTMIGGMYSKSAAQADKTFRKSEARGGRVDPHPCPLAQV